MMRRSLSLLLLVSLVATGAAPLAGERLLCPMPMRSAGPAAGGPGCDACVTDSPTAAASLEAASCCRTAPAAEAETVPATVSVTRRGGSTQPDLSPMSVVLAEWPAITVQSVPAFDSPPPSPAASPPLLSTLTTRLRN